MSAKASIQYRNDRNLEVCKVRSMNKAKITPALPPENISWCLNSIFKVEHKDGLGAQNSYQQVW